MKYETTVHPHISYCHDCEWKDEENSDEIRKEAYRHAKKTGHHVTVEAVKMTHYNFSYPWKEA